MTRPARDAPCPPETPRLRRDETLLLHDRESRSLRALADGFVCVVSMALGVAFHAVVMGGSQPGFGVLFTIALTLAPIFLFLSSRPLAHVMLTDQRIFVGHDPAEMDSADYRQIDTTRLWLATLFIRLKSGATLSVPNMPSLHAIETEILHRSAP